MSFALSVFVPRYTNNIVMKLLVLGSIAEKVFTSIQRLISPPSASSYLDFLIAQSKVENSEFQCFGIVDHKI